MQIKINHVFFHIKVKRKVSKKLYSRAHERQRQEQCIFFFNFDKIIRNKKLAIFQHSLKDLDLLVISIYNKNWCLILYKTKTSKIQTGPISCILRPDTKTSHVCAA